MTIIGIGVDIVDINRISKIFLYKAELFAIKILTPIELIQYNNNCKKIHFLAKRFAVKEAASKAFGTGMRHGLTFSQFELTKNKFGKPSLKLFNKAAKLANYKKISKIHVTLSDEKNYACAIVIFEKKIT